MLSVPCTRFNKLSCLQVLLRWALVSSAAVLVAACLFSCLVGISIWVTDDVSGVDALPSCALVMTVSAVLACVAIHTSLGRRLGSALWVSFHSLSLLPQFAYLPVTYKELCSAVTSCQEKKKAHDFSVLWLKKSLRRRCIMLPSVTCCVCLCVNCCWYQ